MIAKISVSNSPRGALNYNYEKLQEGEARILNTNKIWSNYSGRELSANELAYIFEERAAINKNTKNPFVHISLNPSPDDVLTDERLAEIADEYMEKMGYENQPYIVFKHEDIDRHHLHIITTNIDAQGKKINDSNNFYRSQKATQELEQKYSLYPATKQAEDKQVWQPEKVDTSKKITPQIRNIVKHLTHQYNFQSFEEYRALLSLYNVDVQKVKGEVAEKSYEGLIYLPIDDAGARTGNPIKSSVLGKFAGIKNLNKIYQKAAQKLSENTNTATIKHIKSALSEAMQRATSEQDLIHLAKGKNIDLLLRKNDDGRIYGVTVVDHKTKQILKGSRLGKEFSANAFHSLLRHDNNLDLPQVQAQEKQDLPPQIEQQEQIHELRYAKNFGWMPEQSQAEDVSHQQQPATSFVGGLDSLFNAVGGAETKYIPPKKRKKRKKKDLSI
jgi:hypothetical protein